MQWRIGRRELFGKMFMRDVYLIMKLSQVVAIPSFKDRDNNISEENNNHESLLSYLNLSHFLTCSLPHWLFILYFPPLGPSPPFHPSGEHRCSNRKNVYNHYHCIAELLSVSFWRPVHGTNWSTPNPSFSHSRSPKRIPSPSTANPDDTSIDQPSQKASPPNSQRRSVYTHCQTTLSARKRLSLKKIPLYWHD